MARSWIVSVVGTAALVACTGGEDTAGGDDTAAALGGDTLATAGVGSDAQARATLRDSLGNEVGTVTMRPQDGGVAFAVELMAAPAGVHGIHVHENGSCDAPAFGSAGSHFAPEGRQHGTDNPEGPHAGDLPNVTADANGRGSLTTTNPRLSLDMAPQSLLRAGGTAIVLHATADDYRTDPSGNSGDRIACGVVERG